MTGTEDAIVTAMASWSAATYTAPGDVRIVSGDRDTVNAITVNEVEAKESWRNGTYKRIHYIIYVRISHPQKGAIDEVIHCLTSHAAAGTFPWGTTFPSRYIGIKSNHHEHQVIIEFDKMATV